MNKISFDELLNSMQYFLEFHDVEDAVEQKIKEQTDSILLTNTMNGRRRSEDVLYDYLGSDDREQNRLKAIIALSGGSLEKLKRIVEFWFGKTIGRLEVNQEMRGKIAKFLNNPDSYVDNIPRFVRKSFCLPDNWIDLLKDRHYMSTKFREKMVAHYSVQMGFKVENIIGEMVDDLGSRWEKGSVQVVDNKEVDLAIPSLESPQILIMVSYLLTTSSGQTSKANEQASMYQAVQTYNRSRSRRGKSDCLLINVIDGGGWLARKRDLEQMWQNCDYCFSINTLDNMRQLIAMSVE